ncbi:hypothetical protein BV505_06255 [Thermomonas haemolytica]|nr:hypothetical protein BV505_06255 [Thermomonas haemolytica]
MPTSPPSSSTSASCRFEWRPSRLGQAALLGLAGLGVFCVLACDLPAALAWPGALLVAAGAGVQLRRYRRLPACVVEIAPAAGIARCDGRPLQSLRLRGSLAFIGWRQADGRRAWRLFWPDQLDAAQRRELKLALRRPAAAAGAPSMAR